MASKMIFKVSGNLYNTRDLQCTLNQDHRKRRKKDTQGKCFFFRIFPPTGTLERFLPRLLYLWFFWKFQKYKSCIISIQYFWDWFEDQKDNFQKMFLDRKMKRSVWIQDCSFDILACMRVSKSSQISFEEGTHLKSKSALETHDN